MFVLTALIVILKTTNFWVSKWSIFRSSFFSLSIMTYFRVSAYNFTNDNTLSTFAKRIFKLISILERKFLNKIDWFNVNKVIVNPDKFYVLGIDIKSRIITKRQILIDTQNTRELSSVKLL